MKIGEMRWYRLETQYARWLEENCQCDPVELCDCPSLNDWINAAMEEYFESTDHEDEFYA
jgi:hypothetical protein